MHFVKKSYSEDYFIYVCRNNLITDTKQLSNMAAFREVLTEHFPNIDHEISDYVSSKISDLLHVHWKGVLIRDCLYFQIQRRCRRNFIFFFLSSFSFFFFFKLCEWQIADGGNVAGGFWFQAKWELRHKAVQIA